jgi:hypothetical protein
MIDERQAEHELVKGYHLDSSRNYSRVENAQESV